LARPAFRALANKMDPRKSNGGVFLGLNGIVIKSHGGTDGEGFAYAVDRGYDLVRHELLAKIGETLTRHQQETASPRAAHSASGDARERADGASADARERADVERGDDIRPEPGSSARVGGAGS
jgi:hypothetical protein